MKRRTSFWKCCELLFGLVQQECCNHSQEMEQDQREIGTKSSGKISIWKYSSLLSFCTVQTRTTHKLTHPEFTQVSPFYNAWRVLCVAYFIIQNISVLLPWAGEPQCFSVNFVFDMFLSPLRHLKLCQSGDLFPCT